MHLLTSHEGVKQLLPDIPMTDDYKKLEMRQHNMGKDQVSINEGRTVCISLDFSMWCNALRGESLEPVSQCLDELLGTDPLFKDAHHSFENSITTTRREQMFQTLPSLSAEAGGRLEGRTIWIRLKL